MDNLDSKQKKSLFLMDLEGRRPQVQVPASLFFAEGSLPGLQMGHILAAQSHGRDRKLSGAFTSVYKDIDPTDEGPTLMTSFNLEGPVSKHSHLGVRASAYEFGRL